MADVVLLSEVHPRHCDVAPETRSATASLNPLRQAGEWYGLCTAEERERLAGADFTDVIAWLRTRCIETGKRLIVRDWSHLDFFATPFLESPTHRMTTAVALTGVGPLARSALVRHPLQTWASLSLLPIMKVRLDVEAFLAGYKAFAESCQDLEWVRYEDFVEDPDYALRQLCRGLALRFDDGWRDRGAATAT